MSKRSYDLTSQESSLLARQRYCHEIEEDRHVIMALPGGRRPRATPLNRRNMRASTAMGNELLLVGSVPLDTVEEVMRTFGARLGRYLPAMPDGEVGERRSWVNRFSYLLFNGHPDLRPCGVRRRSTAASSCGRASAARAGSSGCGRA